MMLVETNEKGEEKKEDDVIGAEIDAHVDVSNYTVSGRDNLRGATTTRPITVYNKSDELAIDDDTDDDNDSNTDDCRHTRRHDHKHYNPNKRQRRKARARRISEQFGDNEHACEGCRMCGDESNKSGDHHACEVVFDIVE